MSFAPAAASALTPGLPAQTLALTFRGLAAMLRAGMTLNQALEGAADGAPWNIRPALLNLAHHVAGGDPLSEGLRGYGNLFHPIVPAMVQAGENTGNLDECFTLLAEYFEFEANLTRTLRSAMVYPTIVVITAIIAVGILAWINFMPAAWAIRLLWLCGGVAALWLLLRFRWFQRSARYVSMALPFFGGIVQQLAVARFCHTFGMLTRAGVPYLEGLEATKPVVQHPAVDHAVNWIYSAIRNGNTLTDAIRGQMSFPAIVRNLVGAGEASGSVDDALLRAGQFLRDDAEYKIKNSSKLAGPVMIIGLGVIVCLILVAFWGAYFDKIMSVLQE
jgi:type II secretory pathway component PulF